MRLSKEQIIEDDERWAKRDIMTELRFCSTDVTERKHITNDEIRFLAWVIRKAYELLKEYSKVVFCKECKNAEMSSVSYPQYWCAKHGKYVYEHEHCMNGKRKGGYGE